MKIHSSIQLVTFDFFGVLCAPMYGGLLRDLFPGEEDRYRIWMDMVQYEVDIGKISEDEFLALLEYSDQLC
jgi:hypothetical protein